MKSPWKSMKPMAPGREDLVLASISRAHSAEENPDGGVMERIAETSSLVIYGSTNTLEASQR